jgi:hypothetical protein
MTKRTVLARLAAHLALVGSDLPWSLDDTIHCWSWSGPMSRVTVKPYRRITKVGGKRYPHMAAVKPVPQIWVDGKRRSPLALLYELVTGNPAPRLRPNRAVCKNPQCLNPRHIDILEGVAERFPSIEALMARVGPEFDLEHYLAAFERDPELKKDLIR